MQSQADFPRVPPRRVPYIPPVVWRWHLDFLSRLETVRVNELITRNTPSVSPFLQISCKKSIPFSDPDLSTVAGTIRSVHSTGYRYYQPASQPRAVPCPNFSCAYSIEFPYHFGPGQIVERRSASLCKAGFTLIVVVPAVEGL